MQRNTLTNYKTYNFKALGWFIFIKFPTIPQQVLLETLAKQTLSTRGTDRYNLQNVTIGQYKAEVTGKNFYVRAYTTQENAGNSYDMGRYRRLYE